ncbi:hypothetical protein OG216_42575 [Streptomycetaceae bacterium NBC_01309]
MNGQYTPEGIFARALARKVRDSETPVDVLARSAGIAPNDFHHFLNGRRLPTLQQLNMINEACGRRGRGLPPQQYALAELWKAAYAEQSTMGTGFEARTGLEPPAEHPPREFPAMPHEDSTARTTAGSGRVPSARTWSTIPPPGPARVTTVPEFIKALRDVYIWAGAPSYRRVAATSGNLVARSTISDLFHEKNSNKLPRFDLVMDILTTFGVADVETWHMVWSQLKGGRPYGRDLARR